MRKNSLTWDECPSLLIVSEVAAILRCSEVTVKRKLEHGALKGIKDGKKWLIPKNYLIQKFDTI